MTTPQKSPTNGMSYRQVRINWVRPLAEKKAEAFCDAIGESSARMEKHIADLIEDAMMTAFAEGKICSIEEEGERHLEQMSRMLKVR